MLKSPSRAADEKYEINTAVSILNGIELPYFHVDYSSLFIYQYQLALYNIQNSENLFPLISHFYIKSCALKYQITLYYYWILQILIIN